MLKSRDRKPMLLLSLLLTLCLFTGPVGVIAASNDTPEGQFSPPTAQLFIEAASKLDPIKALLPDGGGQVVREAGGVGNHKGASLQDLQVIFDPATGVTTVKGTLENAKFVLKFPLTWNRQLVLYAHGFDDPLPGAVPVLRDPNPSVTAVLQTTLSQGFAYGYSAFTKVGYAVESGIKSTQLLRSLVNLALPLKRSFILGESMGGNIAMGLVEKYSKDYAGALPVCGVVSSWYQQTRYLSDFALVYDFFTRSLPLPIQLPAPALIEEGMVKYNPAYTPDKVQQSVATLFAAKYGLVQSFDPATAELLIQTIGAVTGVNSDFLSFFTPLYAISIASPDSFQTAGGNGYSNIGKLYSGTGNTQLDQALNAAILRIPATQAATNYINQWYSPTGKFSAKILTVHNLVDSFVPIQHEYALKQLVQGQRNSANLAQQIRQPLIVQADPNLPFTTGPAHCGFTPTELNYAWQELKTWVEQGIKPADGYDLTGK